MTTSTERVFAELREMIVGGELAAGSQHSIYRLADHLAVSRTPVREAVLRLADLGLVSIERNRGVRIRGVTVDDIRAVFELRLLLEVPVARAAAASDGTDVFPAVDERLRRMRVAESLGDETAFNEADREFHALITACLDNPVLTGEVDRLRDTIQARGVSTIGRSRPMGEIVAEHALIADALRAGDPDAAGGRMADHLERTGYLLMTQVAPGPGAVDPAWAVRVRRLVNSVAPIQ